MISLVASKVVSLAKLLADNILFVCLSVYLLYYLCYFLDSFYEPKAQLMPIFHLFMLFGKLKVLLWTETIARYEICSALVVWATNVEFMYQIGSLTNQTSLLG
ncbi:hypothetical protein Hanom_Chr02g00114661 [Helianthus anomalus]